MASTDPIRLDPLRPDAFALGLKMSGLTRDELARSIRVIPERGDLASNPEREAMLPDTSNEIRSDYVLIGGGFELLLNDDRIWPQHPFQNFHAAGTRH